MQEVFSELPSAAYTAPDKELSGHKSLPWECHQLAKTDSHHGRGHQTFTGHMDKLSHLPSILPRALHLKAIYFLPRDPHPPAPSPIKMIFKPEFQVTSLSHFYFPQSLLCIHVNTFLFFSCKCVFYYRSLSLALRGWRGNYGSSPKGQTWWLRQAGASSPSLGPRPVCGRRLRSLQLRTAHLQSCTDYNIPGVSHF